VIKVKVQDMFSLKGKVAVVTGGSSGLGVTFARALAEVGANIVLAARRLDKLNEVGDDLSRLGVKVKSVQCDVSKQDQVQSLVDETIKTFGRLDIMVNNAGVAAMSPATDISVEDWNRVVSVNLTGTFLCARTAAKQMMKREGEKLSTSRPFMGRSEMFFRPLPTTRRRELSSI
jgi:NAD(P)-dependent dehydrogenase (short-subunit alcohol dehydrogenase family)